MKILSSLVCICCFMWFTTVWASDSDKAKLKEAYSQYQHFFNQGWYSKSLPYAEQAVKLGKTAAGRESRTFATLSHNYGINLLRAHKKKEAYDVLADTVSLYKKVYGEEAEELISLYIDLSEAERLMTPKSYWFRSHDQALTIAKKVYGKDSANYGMLLIDLGHEELINHAPNGEARIRRGYKIIYEQGASHPDMYRAEFVMGKLHLSNRQYNRARTHLDAALLKINEGKGENLELVVRGFLIEALENMGESELATEHLLAIGQIKAETGDSSLKPLFIKSPKFPTIAHTQQTGMRIDVQPKNEGKVVLQFDVDEKGFTQNIKVFLLDGPNNFVGPAVEAVKQFRFAPRFVNGKPVKVEGVKYGFNFIINY